MEINLFILYMIEAVCYVQAYVHPIEVWENHFVDSVTRQQVCMLIFSFSITKYQQPVLHKRGRLSTRRFL